MKKKKRRSKVRLTLVCLLGALALAALIFMHFGGFDTGESANPEEFAVYAGTLDDISISEDARIIALGEATHGNVEFQQLKLDVFKLLVQNYGVRAFALEGDYGGCEQVNRYIHGGEGTAQEAAAAIGFAIYRTEEMADLITFMRQYNDTAAEGEDLRFYGFDMQRYVYSFHFLTEVCKELGVDTSDLEKLVDSDNWSEEYDYPARIEIITHVRTELEGKKNSTQAIHFAAMLLQYCEFQSVSDTDNGGAMRDKRMAENAQWIAEQEQKAGCEHIFVAGHNSHVARWGSYDSMGKLLSKELGESYYVIGTDFYKTRCNMPSGSSGRRTNQVFYSHDPLAKAAKTAGLDICWLDFAKASKSPELTKFLTQYIYMGTLGEGYTWFMRLLPPSYRIFQPPAELYDGMILVAEASPTSIIG
ncbi:erythromycin esterase family protein [Oscillibacter sp.]|uniref:erythromycin esterase family protein n=1 Tax=Oscillibacter sp. TaxID=1945593 RepID=UPI0028AF3011|nr:erythromycin esterase family protein [Oscillibacter sp.]